jgi:hypothetical protein
MSGKASTYKRKGKKFAARKMCKIANYVFEGKSADRDYNWR